MKSFNNMPSLKLYQSLIPKRYNELAKAYLKWINLLAVRGLGIKKTSPQSFNLLYRAVSRNWSKNTLLGYLQQEFINENLSLSLLLEPLDGFEWLSKNRYPLTFSTSSPILLQIVTPFARFVAALNHQHPPFYQPFSNLVCIFLGLYILSAPELITLLKQSSVNIDKKELLEDMPLQHQEAKQVLPVITNLIFKYKIACYLGLCRILMTESTHKTEKKLNFLDYVNVFLYGLLYIITVRRKSIKINKV